MRTCCEWQRVRAEILLCIVDPQSKHHATTAINLDVVERLDLTKITTVFLQNIWDVYVRANDKGVPGQKIVQVPSKRNVAWIRTQAHDRQEFPNLQVYLSDLGAVPGRYEQTPLVEEVALGKCCPKLLPLQPAQRKIASWPKRTLEQHVGPAGRGLGANHTYDGEKC